MIRERKRRILESKTRKNIANDLIFFLRKIINEIKKFTNNRFIYIN